MKIFVKTFFLVSILLVSGKVLSQEDNQIINYVNEIDGLWRRGATDSAIEYSLKIYNSDQSLFREKMQNTFSQYIIYGYNKDYASKFIKRLYQRNIQNINAIIAPIYILNAITETNDKDSVEILIKSFYKLLSNVYNYKYKTESYGLLVLQQMTLKGIDDKDLYYNFINTIIRNVKSNPYIDSTTVKEGRKQVIRAWCRFILSYSYYQLYQQDPDSKDAEIQLQLASRYSPDFSDKVVSWAYGYDADYLNKNNKKIGYKSDYFEYLVRKKKIVEALYVLTQLAIITPTNDNCNKLKQFYATMNNEKPFQKYWIETINDYAQAFPRLTLKFIDNQIIVIGKSEDQFTYIDVWGTWCSPCVRELPDLQKLYTKNRSNPNTRLTIYTFSSGSKNLSEFMEKNHFTFPVAEISDSLVQQLRIVEFPTKILITPQGRYLNIPYGVDWRESLFNYCMIE